jgi:hypothetical protein
MQKYLTRGARATLFVTVFVSSSKFAIEMLSYLGPVRHVPARLAWVLFALLLGFGFFIRLAVVVGNDGQDGAEFFHADDVSTQDAVAARDGTLSHDNTEM